MSRRNPDNGCRGSILDTVGETVQSESRDETGVEVREWCRGCESMRALASRNATESVWVAP